MRTLWFALLDLETNSVTEANDICGATTQQEHQQNQVESLLKTLCLEPYVPAFKEQVSISSFSNRFETSDFVSN